MTTVMYFSFIFVLTTCLTNKGIRPQKFLKSVVDFIQRAAIVLYKMRDEDIELNFTNYILGAGA